LINRRGTRNHWSLAGFSTPSAERLVGHNLLVGTSTVIAGLLGFAMQALLSHRLVPADYGAAFTVLSVLMVIWLPANAVMLVIASEASRAQLEGCPERSLTIMWAWHRYLLVGGLALAVLGIGGAGWLARFFDVPPVVFVAAALSVPFGLVLPVLLGELQGHQHFSNFSLVLIGQAAFRLIAAFGFALAFGLLGALVGFAVGNILIYLLALKTVRGSTSPPRPTGSEWRSVLRSLAIILPGSLALAVLLSADVLLVKHFFNAGDAGRYAAVAALGRAIFWGANGIGMVLFPKAVAHESQGRSSMHLVVASIVMCVLGGLVALGTFSLGSGVVLSVFAGPAYTSASGYLALYAVAMILFSAVSVLVVNGQATGKADFLVLLVPATIFEAALIIRFHQTPTQVVQVLTGCMAALLIGLTILYLLQERRRTAVTANLQPQLVATV
jgi:O-antigen/teichoic acid export membrane protein